MQPKAIEFLEELQARRPELAADLQELARLHQRKLWHQLTLKLEACFQTPAFNTGDTPVQLYRGFISDFAHKINLLRLAQFAVHASRHAANPAQARELLQQAIARLEEMKDTKASQPILLLKMHVAQHQLEAGEVAGAVQHRRWIAVYHWRKRREAVVNNAQSICSCAVTGVVWGKRKFMRKQGSRVTPA